MQKRLMIANMFCIASRLFLLLLYFFLFLMCFYHSVE